MGKSTTHATQESNGLGWPLPALARESRIPYRTLVDLCSTGRLEHVVLNPAAKRKRRYVPREAWERFLAANRVEVRP